MSDGDAKKPPPPRRPRTRPATLQRSEAFELTSAEGRVYTISIAFPFEDDPTLELEIHGRKPTAVYALDAGIEFGAVTSLTRLMRWGGEIPPVLAVGIGYPDEDLAMREDHRALDLTPTPNRDPDAPDPGKYGGAGRFRAFLVDKLMPEVERRYGVTGEDSVLVGHSLGGLFTLDTMVNAPGAFRHYLASSPSLWFDRRLVLRQLEEALAAGASYPGRLAVYAGEREERIAGVKARMTSNVLALGALVAAHRGQFGAAAVRIVPGASHHTIYGTSLTEGLRFLLGPEGLLAETY